MKIDSFEKLFIDVLRDIYSGEKQMIKALPKVADAVSSDELRAGLEEHLEETKMQLQRLDDIFTELGVSPRGETCEAMKGLIEEGEQLIDADIAPEILDAALIVACQKIEHYEIATYGALCAFAKRLGHTKALQLLETTLQEEKSADSKLNYLAFESINEQAAAA